MTARTVLRFVLTHPLPGVLGPAGLAFFFAWTWIDPYALGATAPYDAAAILVFEFLFLHSTPVVSLPLPAGDAGPDLDDVTESSAATP